MEINAKVIIISLFVVVSFPLSLGNQMLPYEDTKAHHTPEIQEFDMNATTASASVDSSHLAKNILSSNYTIHGPINITSDEEFAIQKTAEGWEGDGTVENPYIIQGYNITFNGNNILISNVSAHFEIRDCLLTSVDYMPRVGIYNDGICILNSTNGAILNNVIVGCSDAGIFVGWSNCTVMGNQFDQFNGTSNYRGIIFYNSSGSAEYNELLNFEQAGIWVFNSRSLELNSNSITGNGTGIWLHDLENCSVTSNEILNCADDGIQVVGSSDVDLRLNSIADCGRSIYLGFSNEIEVSDNTLVRGMGVMLENLEDCSVTNNEILFALEAGIWDFGSRELMIEQNVIQFAENYGIFTEGSIYCSYTANQISSSHTGINLLGTDNSIFSYNHLVYNDNYGITILYGVGNSLYGNLLGGLGSAIDDGHDNIWDDGESIGNYWSDVYSLNPVSIDGEADAEDRYPLLFLPPDFQMPIITCPPIIRPLSMSGLSGILTWVIWSPPGVYAVYHNEQQLEAGVWYGSGSLGVSTNVLSNGTHTFRLVVTDEESRTTTSTVRIGVPGFECLNDADADGMLDMWEIENGFHPGYDSDANEDADSDGLMNLEEHDIGTDPHNIDSDFDSIPDLWEARNGFDPLNPDIPALEYIGYFHPYLFFSPLSVIPLWGVVRLYRRIPEEKKPRFLRERTVSKSFWLKLIFAFGILLIFPTSLFWAGFMTGLSNDIELESVFMFNTNLFGFEDPTLTFITPITLAAAIIVILPAVYLNRKLREHPANAPILDLSLAAIFGTIVFAYFMVREFPIGIELAIDSSPSPSLMSFSTLVIFVLILVPIFSREASLWGKEKVTEVKIAAKAKFHRVSKYSILGSLWCLAASVLPLACIVETEEDVIISSFISPSFEFNYVAEEAAFSGDLGDWMTISWDVHSVDDLMSYFALVVFQLIFAFYVLRYLRGITSRRRVMQLGILAVFIPFIYCLVTVSNPTMMPFTVAFPLPFVSLLGLLGLRFATPNEPSIERDGRHEYPETTLDDLRIQVPVIYYIKSRLMSWLRKSPKSEAE